MIPPLFKGLITKIIIKWEKDRLIDIQEKKLQALRLEQDKRNKKKDKRNKKK